MRSPLFLLGATVALVAAAPRAHAGGTAACGRAFDQSQVERDEGRLLEARRLLRVCGRPDCSPTQQRLCAQWLSDVEARVPSVVLSAKDGAGTDLVDVKVQLDGAQVATKLDGRAIDVDPGLHTFVFERADGTRVEARSVAEERGKGKVVSARFAPRSPPSITPAEAPASPGGSPLRTAGLVTGAVGLAGLAVGALFGAMALSTKGSDCANGLCNPGASSTAYAQGDVSTAGFIAGGALLAGGLTMFLLAPSGGDRRAASNLALAPVVAPGGGGLQLAGAW